MDSQAEAAIEVTDVASAALEIERRMSDDEPEETTFEQEIEAEEVEDITEETDEETEEIETESEDDEVAEESENFESIYEIAEALNMPVEDFLDSVKATRKINGKDEEVTLSELIAGNQRDTDYRHKTMELAEQRRQLEQTAQQVQAQHQQQLQQAHAMSQLLEGQMLEQYNFINWPELEQNDPQEWLIMRQKFQEDYAKVQQVKQNAGESLKQQQEQQKAQFDEKKQQYLVQQEQLLLSTIPDWQDTNTRKAETKEIHEFLTTNYGFNENDVSQVSDHRVVKLVRDAMKAQAGKQQADVTLKKVKKLPKIIKPSAKVKKSTQQHKRDNLGRFRKSEKTTDDLAQLLLERM